MEMLGKIRLNNRCKNSAEFLQYSYMIPLLSILQLPSTPSSAPTSYHLACSSLDFLGIVIVKVCFFPAADFLLNSALANQTISTRLTPTPVHLCMESMSGCGPLLSFPPCSSLGRVRVAPPGATVLGREAGV